MKVALTGLMRNSGKESSLRGIGSFFLGLSRIEGVLLFLIGEMFWSREHLWLHQYLLFHYNIIDFLIH